MGASPAPPPRAADGRPDLQGVWTNASLTKLTRPAGSPGPAVDEATAEALAAVTEESRMPTTAAPHRSQPKARR